MVVNSVHWFRKGLRLHDNPALQEALNGADTVRCVYILDPWFAGSANVGINRWRFLLESLEDLDSSLRKLYSRLFVVRGQPANVFPSLFKWNVTRLTFEYDSEPYGKERDGAIIKMAQEFGVETIVRNSHTLYNLDRIVEMNNGSPPLTFKRFQALVNRLELPMKPLPTITQEQMGSCRTKIADNHDEHYSVPSLEELVQNMIDTPSNRAWCVRGLQLLLNASKTKCMLFNRSLPAPARPTSITTLDGSDLEYVDNYKYLGVWLDCKLSFQTHIKHLQSKIKSRICFLFRNKASFTHAAKLVFEELLLDADWSVNAGSWMWLSCSAFFQQFFHCYCPVGFGKRTDPSGDYIRRYIPKLKDYPNRYIYEPWRAPESVQKAANCIVGVDYPKPMINHAEGSRLNIERMKQVYQQLSHYKGLSDTSPGLFYGSREPPSGKKTCFSVYIG
uniref:Cryptochrome circadian regulator 2 n=1 Tax=Hucho hucho TaxID=62062 RepID=A0A4W5M1G2_9TELE